MMVLCVSGVNALEKNGAAGLSNMCNLPSVREEMVEYVRLPPHRLLQRLMPHRLL